MKLDTLIILTGFILVAVVLVAVAALFPEAVCRLFTFMDFNGEGPADDYPFCWTPFGGIIR